MESTEQFKSTIEAMLNGLAEKDPSFKVRMNKEGKNMDDCVTYIQNTVKKSGCVGFTDEEVLGMAAHYFDEDNIDVGNPVNCRVVVNHKVELTEEEKAKAREDARNCLIEEEKARLKKRAEKRKASETVGDVQQSLF